MSAITLVITNYSGRRLWIYERMLVRVPELTAFRDHLGGACGLAPPSLTRSLYDDLGRPPDLFEVGPSESRELIIVPATGTDLRYGTSGSHARGSPVEAGQRLTYSIARTLMVVDAPANVLNPIHVEYTGSGAIELQREAAENP